MAAAKTSRHRRVSDEEGQHTFEDEAQPGGKAMGFLDHLEELRVTLVKAVAAFIVAAIIVGVFFDETVAILDGPLKAAVKDAPPDAFHRVTNSVMEIFSVYISVGCMGAFALSFPVILYLVISFVAPALTAREKRLLAPVCAAIFVLFILGGAFSYYVIVPSALDVAMEGNRQFGATLMLSLDSYYSMLMWLILGMGGVCQFPVLIQVLVYLDIVSVKQLRAMWRFMVVLCFAVAALITPTTDPWTMTLCAAPLWVLYLLSLWVASVYTTKLAQRNRL